MSDHDCESPETCGVCHNCQKPGHTAGACPEKKPQCIGCDLTEKLAQRFGWSEEVNCTPWGWLEDQIRDRDRILSDSPDYKIAHEIIDRLTLVNQKLVLDAADRQVALEKAEDKLITAAMEARANASAEHWMDRAMKAEACAEEAEARVKELETELDTLTQSLDHMRLVPEAEEAITVGLTLRAEKAEALLARERACRKRLARIAVEHGLEPTLPASSLAEVRFALAESAALDAEEGKP